VPDAPHTKRLIGQAARVRVALSDRPQWFRACMARTLADIDRGEDLATAVWTAVDPVKTAAEIEALAGPRRLSPRRKDSHV
jgi:hypothetical protein